jgi:hypothetical protein
MADLSKYAAQEIGEIEHRHFQEINARLDKEKALTDAIIERTQWLRMLTMGEMRLEYVTVLDDGRLEYNDPSQAVTPTIDPPAEPSPVETCVEPPSTDTPPDDPEDPPESTNGHVSDEFAALIGESNGDD